MNLIERARWWRDREHEYRHVVVTDNRVPIPSSDYYGDFITLTIDAGTQAWGFRTPEGYARFKNDYNVHLKNIAVAFKL
jgi:hypothetical protein